MLWSVQWIWTKSHLISTLQWQSIWLLECLMLTFASVYGFTFFFHRRVTYDQQSKNFQEQVYITDGFYAWDERLSSSFMELLNASKPHQLALERERERKKRMRDAAEKYQPLAIWLRKMSETAMKRKKEIFNIRHSTKVLLANSIF